MLISYVLFKRVRYMLISYVLFNVMLSLDVACIKCIKSITN